MGPTEVNKADMLTKVLTSRRFKDLRHKMLSLGAKPSVASVVGKLGRRRFRSVL